LILLDSKFVALTGLLVIAKQQTFRHKIKIFPKNGKSWDIVFEKMSGDISVLI
jgi:hypothetical protein